MFPSIAKAIKLVCLPNLETFTAFLCLAHVHTLLYVKDFVIVFPNYIRYIFENISECSRKTIFVEHKSKPQRRLLMLFKPVDIQFFPFLALNA